MKLRVLSLALMFSSLILIQPVAADAPIPGRAGRAEMRFLEGMIDHHMMAIDMAHDCTTKASSKDVTALCEHIIDAQSDEIHSMAGWLKDWYNTDYNPTSMMKMDDHSGMAMGDPVGMMGMMAGLAGLKGKDYEIGWLEAMIDHHDDALHMSKRALGYAQHKELREIALKIIKDQTAEIEVMEALITTLG